MSEELLKTIVKLFAIVAKERITEDERDNMRQFLSLHLNQEAIGHYMSLFESYIREYKVEVQVEEKELPMDDQTLEFLDEWSNIIKISKEVNKALTITQKLVIIIKIIELIHMNDEISERQENLIFYIGESFKVPVKYVNSLQKFISGKQLEALDAPNTLLISKEFPASIQSSPTMASDALDGIIAIHRVPDIEAYFVKYIGNSSLNVNGISLRKKKIDIFPTGSTIRGSKIATVYYSDVISRFLITRETQPLTFSAEHIFYHFKSGRAGIQNVNISETGGKLIGIMGASGSGKSTMLNVLNGTEKPSSGRVILNNINIHDQPEEVQGLIGFVPQDDFLIAEMTVFENLYYAAKLCFKDNSVKENSDLVNAVLSNLGLLEIAGLKVGSPMDKTISGGQRKRINIGLELLREPAVLYVDEPTSGLSSRDSENIMDLLKELSFRGKMIFVVIHQPSSDIFKMFDSLLILDTGGFQIYYGNPTDSVTYFKTLINAANKNTAECQECGNINPEQVFNIIETRIVNEFGRHTRVRKVSPGQWYQYFRDNIKIPQIKHTTKKWETAQKIPHRLSQFFTFLVRDIKTKTANRQYMLINFLQAPVLALFIGFMVRYYKVIGNSDSVYSFAANDNIPVYFFMSVIVSLFMGLTVSAEEIFRDRMILKRERFLHLSKFSYLMSKVIVLFLISGFQTLTFALIGNYILEINGIGLEFWMILFSTSCFANMLGLNISASFNSAVTIYIIIPLLLIPQLLLSGVVIGYEKFNPTVTNMQKVPIFGDVMASRWAFEAAMVTQFKDNPYRKPLYEHEKVMSDAEYKKIYYLGVLDSELAYCFNHMAERFTTENQKMTQSLTLVREEMKQELESFGQEEPSWINRLDIQYFDSTTYYSSKELIEVFHSIYSKRYKDAEEKRNEVFTQWASNGLDVDSLKDRYVNEEVIQLVTNNRAVDRVMVLGNEIIRKIDPIYSTSHLSEPGYRAGFYTPYKSLGALTMDTFSFNVIAIWFMSLLLFGTLFFDALKRFLHLFTARRKRRKKIY